MRQLQEGDIVILEAQGYCKGSFASYLVELHLRSEKNEPVFWPNHRSHILRFQTCGHKETYPKEFLDFVVKLLGFTCEEKEKQGENRVFVLRRIAPF